MDYGAEIFSFLLKHIIKGYLCLLAYGPDPSPQPQFVLDSHDSQFVFEGPSQQFVFTGPGP